MSGRKTPQSKTPKKNKTPTKSSSKKLQQSILEEHQQLKHKQTYLELLKRNMIQQKSSLNYQNTQNSNQTLHSLIKRWQIKQLKLSSSQGQQILQKIRNEQYNIQTMRSIVNSMSQIRLKELMEQLIKIYSSCLQNQKKQISYMNTNKLDHHLTNLNMLKWIECILKSKKIEDKKLFLKQEKDQSEWIKQKQRCQKLLGKLQLISF